MISNVDIPGQMQSGGVPVRLRAVLVKGDADEVASAIVKSFERQGLYVPPSDSFPDGLREWHVTGFDPKSNVSYSVLFRPHDDGTLTLVLGEARVAALLEKRPEPSDFAPLFPAATGVLRTNVEGLRTIGFYARAEEGEVLSFYRQVLSSAGFEAEGEGVFRRRDEQVRLRLSRSQGELFVMLSQTSVH